MLQDFAPIRVDRQKQKNSTVSKILILRQPTWCTRGYVCTQTHTRAHTCTPARTHVHTRAHTHTHTIIRTWGTHGRGVTAKTHRRPHGRLGPNMGGVGPQRCQMRHFRLGGKTVAEASKAPDETLSLGKVSEASKAPDWTLLLPPGLSIFE